MNGIHTPEKDMVKNVLRFEKNYNIFKVILIMFTTTIILGFIFYETTTSINKIKQDNELTRQYITCIAQFFTQSDRASLVVTDLQKCTLERTP